MQCGIDKDSRSRLIAGSLLKKEHTMSEPIYIEVWKVSGNPSYDRVGLSYTDSICPTYSHLLALRDSVAEMYDCKLEYLIRTDTIGMEGADDE